MGKHRDFGVVRHDYVTTDASFAELAAKYEIPLDTLEKAAARTRNGGKTWAELRTEFRGEVARKTAEQAGDTLAKKRAKVADKAADVALKALNALAARLETPAAEETKDLVAAAKLATAVKVELGGDPDGAPVRTEVDLSQLTIDELRRLAAKEE